MNITFRKAAIVLIATIVGVAAIPTSAAKAEGPADPAEPPRLGRFAELRLERTWRRQVRAYEMIGRMLDRSETVLERAERRIDELAAEGKDVTDLQAALDAFEAAVGDVHPLYQGLNGLVTPHRGFDSDGQVIDLETARETVRAMHEGLAEIRGTMAGTWRGLLDALRAFREANVLADGPAS